jgi:hypothetical protein
MNNANVHGTNFSVAPYLSLIKADMLDRIAGISPEAKPRIHSAISQNWAILQAKHPQTKEHQDAIAMLSKYGTQIRTLVQQHQARQLAQGAGAAGPSAAQLTAQASAQAQARMQGQQGQQQGQNTGQVQQAQANAQAQLQAQQARLQQQAQNQQAQQQNQATMQQQGQGQQNQPQQGNQQAAQRPGAVNGAQPTQAAQPQPSQAIRAHVASFPFTHPPSHPEGTPEGKKWLEATTGQYTTLLIYLERANAARASRVAQEERLRAAGQPIPAQLELEKQQASAQYLKFKTQLDTFRQNQAKLKEKLQEQRMAAEAKKESSTPTVTAPNNNGIPAKPFNLQQPPAGNNSQQATMGTNTAADSAKANTAGNAASPTQAQTPTQGQAQASQGPFARPGNMTATSNPSRPSLNTAQPGQSSGAQGQPGTAGSQQPTPLSHGDALHAARSHSEQRPPTAATPTNVINPANTQHHTNMTNQQHKFPISKTLPHSVMNPPQPVMTGPSRPTMANGGASSQPIIAKQPTFTLEGDGSASVLSKKKLHELVRQVTGGAETVTPEVEEVSHPQEDNMEIMLITPRSSWKLQTNLSTASSLLPVG